MAEKTAAVKAKAARNVNIIFSNWRATGQKVQVNQYSANLQISWIDKDGNPQSWSGAINFPNDLALVPLPWLKEELAELIVRAARKRLGIDEEETE